MNTSVTIGSSLNKTTSSGVSDFKQYCSPALKDSVYLSTVYCEEIIKNSFAIT